MSNPHQPPQFQPQPSGNKTQRNLIIALAAAAVVLIIVLAIMVAVAMSGGDSGTEATSTNTSSSSPIAPDRDENGDRVCWRGDDEDGGKAIWDADAKKQPQGTLMITDSYDLPATHDQLAGLEVGVNGMSALFIGLPYLGLAQFQDQSIGVISHMPYADPEESTLAVVDPSSGAVVAQYDAGNADAAPSRFDLAPRYNWGYHRVETSNAEIQLPAEAAGTEDAMKYAIAVQPDAFDKGIYWVLLRGSDALYKAELLVSNNWRSMGDSFGDTSQCGTQ